MRLSDMPLFEEVLDGQLSDPRFRDEWERTRLAREVAVELVRHRADHGLTQAALARRAGVSRSTIARLEVADHEPSTAGLRDRYLLVLGFALMARRSELAAPQFDDPPRPCPPGCAEAHSPIGIATGAGNPHPATRHGPRG